MMSFFFFFFFCVLISRSSAVFFDCPLIELCDCDTQQSAVVCDGNNANQSDNTFVPSLALLPSVEEYSFLNFKQFQSNAFENLTFPGNRSITIRLINISIIHPDAFSTSMFIPAHSTVSIDIEQSINPASITLRPNAFDHNKIHRLRFSNINNFNGRPIFNTTCFGEHLQIDELVFEQSTITGFSNSIRKPAVIKKLSIRNCPSFTQLTDKSLPTFLATTESLEIVGTGLQLINSHTFQAWSLVLRELIIQNNMNFQVFSSNMIDGVLMKLDKLDLSNNSINVIEEEYDWFAYSYAKHLVLRQQQHLDLVLKTKILETLNRLKTIDISESFISENNDDLIQNYVPNMPNLVFLNVSYTNLTENMIIDLLTRLSYSANQTITISLLGHTLNDSQFCLYFAVFDKAPNLLHLELDETHECNCVVDLFYQDEHIQVATNESLERPKCLPDTRRTRCDIQAQLELSKCSVAKPNPEGSGDDDGNIGNYAFTGIMIGLGVVLLILLLLGTGIAYRTRQNRRATILDMEEPIENPLALIIEERLQKAR